MINIHINNTLYIVKSRDDLVLKFLPSGCPGDAPQRFGALGCGEPHRATGRENEPWMSHVGPIFRSCFDVFFGCSKKKNRSNKKLSPKKKHDKGMKHRSLGDKLLDVSSWDGRTQKVLVPGRSRTGALEQHKLCGQRASRRGRIWKTFSCQSAWRILMVNQ